MRSPTTRNPPKSGAWLAAYCAHTPDDQILVTITTKCWCIGT